MTKGPRRLDDGHGPFKVTGRVRSPDPSQVTPAMLMCFGPGDLRTTLGPRGPTVYRL